MKPYPKFASRPRDEEDARYHYDWPEALVALERHTGENKATKILADRLSDPSNHYRIMVLKWLESAGTDRAYEAMTKFVSRSRDEEAVKKDSSALTWARAALERRNARKTNSPQTNAAPAVVETKKD